jgi:hypothetical protein
MSAKYEWTPDTLTSLRGAWRNRPDGQTASAFDREFADGLGITPRTVQRTRIIHGLKSNPRRVN